MPKSKKPKPILPKHADATKMSNEYAADLIDTFNKFLYAMAEEVDKARRLPHEEDLDIAHVRALLALYRRVSKPLVV